MILHTLLTSTCFPLPIEELLLKYGQNDFMSANAKHAKFNL